MLPGLQQGTPSQAIGRLHPQGTRCSWLPATDWLLRTPLLQAGLAHPAALHAVGRLLLVGAASPAGTATVREQTITSRQGTLQSVVAPTPPACLPLAC